MASRISLTVTHRGTAYALSFAPDTTLSELKARLAELTTVEPALQKLLYKGKKNVSDDVGLEQAGLRSGMKVQMLGSTSQELGGMKAVENESRLREEILRQRASKGPTKLRSTTSPATSATNYIFHRLEPLAHLPNPASALALLQRLSADPAIAHVMRTHEFAVGVLTELAPHEQPHLLGLNVGAGRVIKLRLRTDAYDGFRAYADVRRVLCHELAHNVWGDHDNNFKTLNSQLNTEVAEFERAARTGAHVLGGGGDVYEPSPALEAGAHAHILGGTPRPLGGSGAPAGDSREERRRRILDATINRLRREEEELEQSCGTAGPSATE